MGFTVHLTVGILANLVNILLLAYVITFLRFTYVRLKCDNTSPSDPAYYVLYVLIFIKYNTVLYII